MKEGEKERERVSERGSERVRERERERQREKERDLKNKPHIQNRYLIDVSLTWTVPCCWEAIYVQTNHFHKNQVGCVHRSSNGGNILNFLTHHVCCCVHKHFCTMLNMLLSNRQHSNTPAVVDQGLQCRHRPTLFCLWRVVSSLFWGVVERGVIYCCGTTVVPRFRH